MYNIKGTKKVSFLLKKNINHKIILFIYIEIEGKEIIVIKEDTYKIKINSIKRVLQFVQTISQFDNEVDILSGHYIINGKSIMGIFSLNINEPLTIKIHGHNKKDVLKAINEFLID